MTDDYTCDVCGGPTVPQAFSAGREYWCDNCDSSFLYRNDEPQSATADAAIPPGRSSDDEPRRLRWGQRLDRDANKAGAEVSLPAFDGATHIGDIELSEDDTRVLTAMLADLVVSLAPAYRNPVKRLRFDLLDDDKLNYLYDRLEVAEQFLAAFVVRGNPETWQQQAEEIGRLTGRLDEYEKALNWQTTCLSCSRVLTSSYEATGRAELAEAAIARVREIHQPIPDGTGFIGDDYGVVDPACSACGTHGEYAEPWPCPTIAAVDGDTPKDQT